MSNLTLQMHSAPEILRRGMVPTPEGALPKPKRRRRGYVDLAAWDRAVEADNAANGTASICDHRQAVDAPAAQAAPTDPDAAMSAPGKPGGPQLNRMAIMEDDDTEAGIPASVEPQPEATEPEPEPEAFVPPPPETKTVKRQPK